MAGWKAGDLEKPDLRRSRKRREDATAFVWVRVFRYLRAAVGSSDKRAGLQSRAILSAAMAGDPAARAGHSTVQGRPAGQLDEFGGWPTRDPPVTGRRRLPCSASERMRS